MSADDAGLNPLPEGVPDWADIRDSDPDFEALSAEMARMASMIESAASPPDWKLVADRGLKILSGKGKDIQVATYTAVGLFETRGMAGFSQGMKILADLFVAYAETAYPTRKRGRVNAVRWWMERAEEWLSSHFDAEIEQSLFESVKEGMGALDAGLSESLGDSAPLLAGIMSAVGRIPVKAPPPPPASADAEGEDIAEVTVEGETTIVPAAAQSVPPPAATTSAAPPAAQVGAVGSEEARRVIQPLLVRVRDVADKVADTGDFLPYRLRRLAAWATLGMTPPAEGGRTSLEPPETHIIQSLNSQLDSGNYQAALRLAEEQVEVYLFWLDPHRVAASALSAMGQTHQAAMVAVQNETRAFVKRFPAVSKLAFSDGTPFADVRTKTWLAGLEEGGGGGGIEISPAVQEAIDKAKGLSGASPDEALDVLSQAFRSAGHPRDALLLRVEVLKTFSSSGKREASLAQIPLLIETLDKHRLDTWDSGLASQVLAAAVNALSQEEDAELLTVLRQRLARVAPERYIKM